MGTIPCDSCNCCAPPGQPPCSDGCCKCPPSGDICFDILECSAYYLAENPETLIDNWYPTDSCCDEMSFTLTHALGYSLCNEEGHNPGVPDPDDESTCLTTGTGVGMPTGTGTGELPELWGFSGTVCGDCSGGPSRPAGLPWSGGWDNPSGYWAAEECDGMCVRASLCCCVAPFGGEVGGGGGRCAGGAALPERNSKCACGVTCYKFTMSPFDCHEIPNTVLCPPQVGSPDPEGSTTFMSACSPCSFMQTPTTSGVIGGLPPLVAYTGCDFSCETQADVTGSTEGRWSIWTSCPPAIARGQGECGVIPYSGSSSCSGTCPNSSGSTSFMVLVEGIYESQCDCAVGVMDFACGPSPPCPTPPCPPGAGGLYDGSGVGFMKSVFVKFTALLSEC